MFNPVHNSMCSENTSDFQHTVTLEINFAAYLEIDGNHLGIEIFLSKEGLARRNVCFTCVCGMAITTLKLPRSVNVFSPSMMDTGSLCSGSNSPCS